MIYITGDTHGEYNEFLNRIYQYKVQKDDIVIVCGDFGFVWDLPYHRYNLARLASEPFTIAFVDGNHEDFTQLSSYPVEEWNGGKVHRINNNIIHLMRGQCFTIEGHMFFTMGGAYSIDKAMRTEGKSWWKEELPNQAEYETASQSLESCGYAVDYVITHTVPQSAIYALGVPIDMHDAELTGYFEWLHRNLRFKTWFAGHFHMNKTVRDNIRILMDEVVCIGKTE